MTIQEYKTLRADVNQAMEDMASKYTGAITKLENERKNGESAHLQKMQTWADTNFGEPMTRLKTEMSRLEDAIAAIQAQRDASVGSLTKTNAGTAGSRFVTSEEFKTFAAAKGKFPRGGSNPTNVGTLWGMKRSDLLLKAPSLIEGEDAFGTLVTPWYRSGILDMPKNMPILREFVPVIPVPIPTNTIKTDREASESLVATTLTADAASTDTTANLTSVSGLGDTRPFNELIFTDETNSNTQTVLISSISALVVTFAPALTDNYTAALTRITARQFDATAEGALKPQGYDVYEDYDVNIVTLAQYIAVTTQKLKDIPTIQDLIDRRLLNRLARMEDLNEFYGDGSQGQMTGIFEDADVTAMADQSAGIAGEQEVDYLLDAYFDLAEGNYTADLAIVRPDTMKAITKMKGADGKYIYFTGGNVGAPQGILTMALRWSNQLVGNDAVVGQFAQACTIYDRQDATIEVGMIDDQMIRNLRTVLGELRVGFGIERPLGLRTLDFDGRPPSP